ncbi:DUF5801 repeats-in-toxin domain-containing protein, partial [Aminobacter sp. HY435]|uniref:DUF5801 repeats-in-toxin domain-containing protein n=1 Tax=Aminobacter sp. HY435 TaxID=2970917 RepID=UPI0022B98DB9
MATSIDLNTLSAAVNGDEGQAVEAASETQLLAQAQQPVAEADPVPVDAGSGQPVQAQPAAVAPASADSTYVADVSNVVHLPASVAIDNIRVAGEDLILEQADGSLVVIKDAAANVPTFLLGDVEVPRVALIAALEAGGINVAFGADGSISAGPGSPSSSGGNFDVPAGGIGDGFDLSALLPPTALQFPQYENRELFPGLRRNRGPEMRDFEVAVSEEGLKGGIEDYLGSNDTTDQPTVTGSFPATDADGDQLSYVFGTPTLPQGMLQLTSGGLPILWLGAGTGTLVGVVGDKPIITIVANGSSYSVTISGPIDHPNDSRAGNEDDLTLAVPVTVSDGKGGTVTANMSVTIEDDSPTVAVGAVADADITLVTQDAETIGSASDTATASFAAAFLAAVTPSYGADGAGTTAISGYALSVADAASGLTSNGEAITLTLVNGAVVGSTVGGGEIFRISVDANGTVTLKQSAEIDHLPETADATNDNANIALAAGKVTLSATATVTDGDNDTATTTVSVDLGGNISFDDDVPSLTVGAVADADITLVTQDAETIGSA